MDNKFVTAKIKIFPFQSANRGQLRTHIMGVILHGHKIHFYVDLLQWPHDSNLVLNSILQTLYCKYKEERKLPPILYIQMDNCSRENKNRFIIGFFSILVQIGLVNEVLTISQNIYTACVFFSHLNQNLGPRVYSFCKVSTLEN